MKKNKNKIRLLAMSITLVLVATLFSACQKTNDLKISQFKSGGEIEYKYADWKASVAEVKESLPYSIEKIEEVSTDKYDMYRPTEDLTLNGYDTNVVDFEFSKDGKLRMIMIPMQMDTEDYDECWKKLYSECTKAFGEPTKETKISEDKYAYGWTLGDTRFTISGEKSYRRSTIAIGVSDLTQFPDIPR